MSLNNTTQKMRGRSLVDVKKTFTEEQVFGKGQASPYPLKDIGRVATGEGFVRATIIGFQNGGVLHVDGRILQAYDSPNGIVTNNREILPARKIAAFKNGNPGTVWVWVKGQKIPSAKQQREALEREHSRTETERQGNQPQNQAAPSKTKRFVSSAGRLAARGAAGSAKWAGRTAMRGTVGAVSHAAALPISVASSFMINRWNEGWASIPGRKKPFQIRSGGMDIQRGVAGLFSKGIYGIGRGALGTGRLAGRVGRHLLTRNNQVYDDPAIGATTGAPKPRPSEIMGEPFPEKSGSGGKWDRKKGAGLGSLTKNLEAAFKTIYEKLDAIKASVDSGFAGMKETVKDSEWNNADPHKLARIEAEREAQPVQGNTQFGPENQKKQGLLSSILGAIGGKIAQWATTFGSILSGALLAAFVTGPVNALKKIWRTAAEAGRNARSRISSLGSSVRNSIRSLFTKLSDNFNRNFVRNSPQALDAQRKLELERQREANRARLAEARAARASAQPRGPKGDFIKASPRSIIPAETLDGKPKPTPQMKSARAAIPAETLDGKPQETPRTTPKAGAGGGGLLTKLMRGAIIPALVYELGTHGIELGMNKFGEHVLGRESVEMPTLLEKFENLVEPLKNLLEEHNGRTEGDAYILRRLKEQRTKTLTEEQRSRLEDRIREFEGTVVPKSSERLENNSRRSEEHNGNRPSVVPIPIPMPSSEPDQMSFPTGGQTSSNGTGGGVGSATSTAANMLEFKLFGLNQGMIG